MQCADFVALVGADLSHDRADHVASILSQFPDGVTETMLAAHKRPRPFTRVSTHLRPNEVIEVCVRVMVSSQVLELDTAGGNRQLLHLPDARLQPLLGSALLGQGRRLRIVGGAIVETAAGGDGPLLLLPTPHAVIVLDASDEGAADRWLLESVCKRVRGCAEPPSNPLLLRLSRVTDEEVHGGRRLRRLLLCDPDSFALEDCEIEVCQ